MKFLTFTLKNSSKDRFGFVFEDKIIDINKCAEWIKDNKNNSSFNRIPSTLTDSLIDWDVNLSLLTEMNELIKESDDEIMADKEYIACNKFSYADIQAVTSLQFLVRLNKIDINDYKNLSNYVDNIALRPSFTK